MSYDLFFCVPVDREPLSKEDFRGYFQDRRWFMLQNNQAFYGNEDTGVYFTFDYEEGEKDPERDADLAESSLKPARVSFNLNFYRPSIFSLEAEPEVAAFVRHFSLLVDDPQNDGMGRGEYSGDGFLRGWNVGNLFGVSAIASREDGDEPLTLPRAEIQRCWRWNRQRQSLQERLGENVFVPKIMFCLYEDRVRPFTVWGDAIPIVLPRTDLVFLFRKDLLPQRLFKRKPDFALTTYDDTARFFTGVQRGEPGTEYRELRYTSPPREIVEFFQSRKAFPARDFAVSVDKILDAELVKEAKEKGPSCQCSKSRVPYSRVLRPSRLGTTAPTN